jgi:predicted ATP-dependent endonuclease of OLD family
VKLLRAVIKSHRSIDFLDIRLGGFTVLFGKNNAGKTNLLEALFGVLAPNRMADPHIAVSERAVGIRAASKRDLTQRAGAVYFQLEDCTALDDEIRVLRHESEAPEPPDFPAVPDGQVVFISDQWGDDPVNRTGNVGGS